MELAEALKALDVSACQLALVPCIEAPAVWGDAARILREAGIDPVSGMLAMSGEDYSTLDSIRRTGGVALDENWLRNLERAREVAHVAQHWEIPLVTFHAGFLPHDPKHERRPILLKRVAAIAAVFGEHGIQTALETGQESADTLLSILHEPELSTLGVNFDPANMILYGMGDPVAALQQLRQRIMQIHIKDAIPTEQPGEWGTEVTVGEGAVDWPAFFQIVETLPRRVNFIIEREAGRERIADIAIARDLVAGYASW